MSYRPVVVSAPTSVEGLSQYLFQELLRISEDLEHLDRTVVEWREYLGLAEGDSPEFAGLTLGGEEVALLRYLQPRNYILNGAFRINQRVVSAATSSGERPVDRFRVGVANTTGAFSCSQETSAGFSSVGNTFLKLATTGTASPGTNTAVYLHHAVLGYDVASLGIGTSQAKTITIVFKTRANAACTLCLSLLNLGDPARRSYVKSFEVTAGEKEHAITIPLDTTGTWETGKEAGMLIRWAWSGGTDFETVNEATWEDGNHLTLPSQTNMLDSTDRWVDIADVRMFEGNKPYPMVLPSYDEEISQCQYYYQKSYADEIAPGATTFYRGVIGLNALVGSTSGSRTTIEVPVSMRDNPTVTLYSSETGAADKVWHYDGNADLDANVNSSRTNQKRIQAGSVSDASIADGDYIEFHFTADADI